MGWKLRRSQAGGGALTDLGSHIIDLIRYLLGEFSQVLASTHTYVTERPTASGSSQRERVDVDDAAWVQAKLANGAVGTLFATRVATGAVDDLNVEVYGQRGALRFSLMDPNWLYAYDQTAPDSLLGGPRGWTRYETIQRYPSAATPPGRAVLGWNRTHAQNLFAFLTALVKDEEPVPGIIDGLRVHEVVDAAYASATTGTWVEVER